MVEVLNHKNQTKHLDKMMEQRKVQDKEFIQDDECDDLVDVVYNSAAYNKTNSVNKANNEKY